MYKDKISELINKCNLNIDLDIKITGKVPTMASSEFLTNKEQGDWAESVVLNALNDFSQDYFAVHYGRSDTIAAGDPGFEDFYIDYQKELNEIGKKPDILIFRRADFQNINIDIENDEIISKAIAAIEVRSSSFLSQKYSDFMNHRIVEAIKKCNMYREVIIFTKLGETLQNKNLEIYNLLKNATDDTFRNLDFRCPSWSLTDELRELTANLKSLKENIKILQKRDYLSITPKVEDIALVNRWIQKYNVRHFYLQVFFDKAYILSFEDIISLINPENEGVKFSIERDEKNQRKTTVKIDVQVGKEIIGQIDMPQHQSIMKELERGRLLFFVRFSGGRAYLDNEVFINNVVNV